MAEQNPTKLAPVEELESADPEALIGQNLAGRYAVERRIGKGGMGVVYLASQSALNRKVVVKVLSRTLNDEDEASTRFEREALGLSQLQHPNIVTIFDFGRDRDLAYIVMEYVEGDTLSQFLRRAGRLPFEDFAVISAQILDALAEAHSRGIIHRDIKPSNIMLCERHGQVNFVKVLDFGLAKLVNDSVEVTKKQNLVGSVAFLAPEQILGLEFDQRVDVYALGVLFYYMLSGQKPFSGEDDLAILYQHIHKAPTPLDEVLGPQHNIPPEVIRLVHQCLAKDPNERPANARELLNQLQLDLSRSVFQLPWSTGEMPAMDPSMAGMSRSRSLTPHSGLVSVSPNTDLSGQIISGVYNTPSGEFIIQTQPARQRSSTVIIASLLALLIGGGVVAAILLTGPREEQTAAAAIPQTAALASALDEVEAQLKQQRWGQADAMLQALQPQLSSHPALLARAAGQSDQLATGKLMATAQAAEARQDLDAARDAYLKVLERQPEHAQAREALSALAPEAPPEAVEARASLKVDARVKARVSVDGDFFGYTPVTASLPPGAHEVLVEAPGYHSWSQSLILEGDESRVLDAQLNPMGPGKVAKARASGKKPAAHDAADATAPAEEAMKPADAKLFEADQRLKRNNDLLPVGN